MERLDLNWPHLARLVSNLSQRSESFRILIRLFWIKAMHSVIGNHLVDDVTVLIMPTNYVVYGLAADGR